MKTDMAVAWDARITQGLLRLPTWARTAIEWLRHPRRQPCRLVAALLLIVGGMFAILPVLGLWMLPIGLALLSDDLPWLKAPLEAVARRCEAIWHATKAAWRRLRFG